MARIFSTPRITTPDGMVITLYLSDTATLSDRGSTLRWLWNRGKDLSPKQMRWLSRNGIVLLGYELVAYVTGDTTAAATDMRLTIRRVLVDSL